MHSYQKEVAANEPHNLLTVVMHAYGMSLQEAIDWTGERIEEFINEFVDLEQKLFWTDRGLDQSVREHINTIASVLRGYNCWAFEAERYFGKDLDAVRESRTVVLSELKKKFICWE